VQVSWHELPLRNSLDVKSAKAITGLIQAHQIDLVHAHVGRDYLIAALACRQARKAPLVLTRHHYLPVNRSPIYRWLLSDVAAIIAVSDSVRLSVLENLNLPLDRVRTIPNWIDPSRFQPIDRDAARALFSVRRNIVVACIGALNAAKGHEEFIRAAARVAQMRTDVEFVLAGDESETGKPFTESLKSIAGSLGLGDRLRLLGYVRNIPELLAASDVVVVPSWDEGFSLVTIEALAARRAVLGSNVGGIAGIITDNQNGLLFTPRDVQSLTDKLLWLVADAPLRERLAIQGQRDVYARFGREQVIDQIESLYFEMIAGA
jgi:glycosyltransferase involved in cell wall biosynthesis